MRIKIDRKIPPPPPRNRYPFDQLKIGDSFALPVSEATRLRSAASNAASKLGWRFTVSINGEEVRCWRISN